MIKAYIDSTEGRVTIHNNPNCASARIKMNQDQRSVLLNVDSVSRELRRFRGKEYRFVGEAGKSDMWLILDLQDAEFENALVSHLLRLLPPLQNTAGGWGLQIHC